MPGSILFISDLHLDASRPEIIEQFLRFLSKEARNATALYILGDLFEYWIGDDDPEPDKVRIQRALRDVTTAGVPCYVMHGNRDFLLGKRFCQATGCSLLADGAVVDILGNRTLLLHGDLLCIDDHAYQRLRRRVRNPFVQFVLRNLPLAVRNRLAAKMRAGSQAHIENSLADNSMASIMDVNTEAVIDAFRRHKVDTMIHGHTHRPAIHTHSVDGHAATRIVLGDWYTQGSVLRWHAGGYKLESLARN